MLLEHYEIICILSNEFIIIKPLSINSLCFIFYNKLKFIKQLIINQKQKQ